MTEQPRSEEWDQLVTSMGRLTLAAGNLEMAIIAMVCRILGKREEEFRINSNSAWCDRLNKCAPTSWSDDERKDLAERLSHIRKLYRKRNSLIHAALGVAGENAIPGIPAGGIIDLRTYGVGFTKREGNTFTIGIMGQRIHPRDVDVFTDELLQARIGLAPYMALIDKMRHPPKPFPMPELGKLL